MTSSVVVRAPRLALLSGSLRKGSFNTRLISAAEKIASNLGAETSIVDLGMFDLPVYSQDLETSGGMPPAAVALKETLGQNDGWVIASPEYNGFPTPLLINAYTWCSRGDPSDGPMYATFQNKAALVVSASPGGLGGMRNHNPHRQLLQNLGVHVLPSSVAVGGASGAFDGSGNLTEDRHIKMLEQTLQSMYFVTRDTANRDATCQLVEEHLATVGTYGAVPQ